MLEKGSFSFVALLVVNPVLILMFQNCSFAPVAHSEVATKSVESHSRMVSSVGIMNKAAPGLGNKSKSFLKGQQAMAPCKGTDCAMPIAE